MYDMNINFFEFYESPFMGSTRDVYYELFDKKNYILS